MVQIGIAFGDQNYTDGRTFDIAKRNKAKEFIRSQG
jgi:hypothetical protein